MRKAHLFLILGIWVAILPYLGFPYSWKDTLTTVSGLGLIYFSFTFHQKSKLKVNKKKEIFDNFSENKFEDEKKK